MTLNVATASKLIGLANRILSQYGAEIKAVLTEITGDAAGPPPVPVPLPTDPEQRIRLPIDFDESYYRAKYSDIRDAIADKKISSGAEHYVTWGWKEGREYKALQVAPLDPPRDGDVTQSTWMPADSYYTPAALIADLAANKFSNAVALNGSNIHDGFGPQLDYHTASDGTVVRGSVKGLLDEYSSVAALLDHVAEVKFDAAVFVDDISVTRGFIEAYSPRYVSQPGGRIKRKR